MPGGFDDLDLDSLRLRTGEKWSRFPPDVLPAFVAEMDFHPAAPITEALTEAVMRGDLGYAPELVIPSVADAFAGFAQRRWGWPVDPGRVYVLPDVMRGIELWIDRLTKPRDGVVINTPVYFPFLGAIQGTDRVIVEAPMVRDTAGYAPDLDALEDAFRDGCRLYLLCNPHNPTGRVFTLAELSAIAELALRYDVSVVADEIHAPLVYEEGRHIPFASLGPDVAARTLTLHSASKAWNLAGLLCALAIPGSAEDGAYLEQIPYRVRGPVSILGVTASVASFRDGEAWLDELLTYLDGNRDLLRKLLADRLPGVEYVPPEATYLAWLDCRGLSLDSAPAAHFLERGKVALAEGSVFGPPGQGFVRLTFGTSRALLTALVDRMADAVR